MVKVLVCGGGNGAHVLAGLGSNHPNTEVRVFTLFRDEAERWSNTMENNDFKVICHIPGSAPKEIIAKPTMVTKDPAKAVPGVDMIILVVPAFAHQGYLDALKQYVKPGVILVGLPGQAGFEFAVRGSWGDLTDQCTLMSFESLPWAARIKEFGHSVEVLGTKEKMQGAVHLGQTAPVAEPTKILQDILGPEPVLLTCGHLIGITLMGLNAYVHPSIMYGRWHHYDGQSLDETPLFYHGMNQIGADAMSGSSDEILAIAKAITQQRPKVDLSNVSHIFAWYVRTYSNEITDTSSLYNAIRSNEAYIGLKHPMVTDADGKVRPDFKSRYMTEDIPCGLVVMKGIAEVVGVPTPNMDKIIGWAQKVMGKEYIVDGKIQGRDLGETRVPQKYGLFTLDELLGKNY